MTYIYDAQKMTAFHVLFKWHGTMLPLVFKSVLFWVLICIHAVLLILSHMQAGVEVNNVTTWTYMFTMPTMPYSTIGTVTALLTFFIVFYGSQSYARLTNFYGHLVGVGGNVMNWVALVRLHLPDDPNLQWNAVRLVLAAMHVQCYTLNESKGGKTILPEEWALIVKRNLLKPSEIQTLRDYQGFKPFLPMVWAMSEVEAALAPTSSGDNAHANRYIVADLLSNFREVGFAFRGHCGQITNWLKHPVPFPYFHVLTLLLLLDLLLISYGLAVLRFHFVPTALIYTIICMCFLGLKEVAVTMSDPFGDDDVDFDLESMLSGAYKNAVAVLRDGRRPDMSDIGELMNPILDDRARFTVQVSPQPSQESPSTGMLAEARRSEQQPTYSDNV